jgi:hypothetical protein
MSSYERLGLGIPAGDPIKLREVVEASRNARVIRPTGFLICH